MQYIIGVDGGGTKTEAVAYSLNGDYIYKSVSGFGNVMVNEKEALNNIIKAIDGCIEGVYEKTKDSKCIFICAGLAGVEAGNYSTIIKQKIEEYFKINTKVVNDAVIAHASLLKGRME
ncbi:BadF/BadG/BcrA/BcrD ATPase family protein [Caloramator sp. mosi_1]|uniref:BadF/BadG/BcrA/BcrD ATPase family protein n=1 Tax=Caloramator sp. mosi_1 TaxID=3023090 RepID=UPI00235FBF06|nr:BadF/BadG/BcrA/BcrD ATPase family protein [Caloramator sp. mosi_1]WDC84743.1 BadF/BadG/BcrA/BcrD ATPase family protein [Caloramator sp. mosi_1]